MNNADNNKHNIRFFYNGLKVGKGPLQKGYISCRSWKGKPLDFCVYARNYTHFSLEVRETFDVKNETDTMTDYFEEDRFFVGIGHPLFKAVAAAFLKADEKAAKRAAKKGWKHNDSDARKVRAVLACI